MGRVWVDGMGKRKIDLEGEGGGQDGDYPMFDAGRKDPLKRGKLSP